MIKIDLRTALTDEAIKEALPNIGLRCRYTAPCIIGACMSFEDRQLLRNEGCDGHSIWKAVKTDLLVEFATPEQFTQAQHLQWAFDGGKRDDVMHWIKEIRNAPSQD